MKPSREPSDQLVAADDAFRSNKFKLAGRLCERILRKQPESAQALHLLGLVRQRQDRPEDAIELLRRSITADPSSARAHSDLGNVLALLGRAAEAVDAYQASLDCDANAVDVWNNLAAAQAQTGALHDAGETLRKAIARTPKVPELHVNLGNVLSEDGSTEEAALAYQRALELNPKLPEAQRSLGAALVDLGQPTDAIALLRSAIERRPHDVPAIYNLGLAFARAGNTSEAIESYSKAIASDPYYVRARESLGRLLMRTGRTEDAIAECRDWLAVDPDNPIAKHLLAAWTGDSIPSRASDDYVKATFDNMAEHFDSSLAKLEYSAPDLIRNALSDRKFSGQLIDVLDAGCGTGLCAGFLRPMAKSLIGIDLSKGMLERARRRRVYDELIECELTSYLNGHPKSADLLVAADTFNYFGELSELFSAVRTSLRPGGCTVFTLEHGDDSSAATLCEHGRYSHSETFLRDSLAVAELHARRLEKVVFRTENAQPVRGFVVIAELGSQGGCD